VISFKEVADISNELSEDIARLEDRWKSGIRTWRHKRLSHNDLPTVFREKDLPEVSNKDIAFLVSGITDFARRLESHVFERDQDYEVSIAGWVPQLTRYLRLGIQAKKSSEP
jgi:hypothetical protein